MADRVSVTIKIGGELSASLLDDFCTIIDSYRLTSLSEEPFERSMITGTEPLELGAHEVAWGSLGDLEAFCQTHGLWFSRWCDARPGGWEAERLIFDGSGDTRSYGATSNDLVVITAAEARSLGSQTAIDAFFSSSEPHLPPLRIVPGEVDHG